MKIKLLNTDKIKGITTYDYTFEQEYECDWDVEFADQRIYAADQHRETVNNMLVEYITDE